MGTLKSEGAVAVVDYRHRMPRGIDTDEDFWRLLNEPEFVQKRVTSQYGRNYRPIGGFPFAGLGRFAKSYEELTREDGEKFFDRSFFGLSRNGMSSTDLQLG